MSVLPVAASTSVPQEHYPPQNNEETTSEVFEQDDDEDLKYLMQVLELRKQHLGENHPDVTNVYSNIGTLLKQLGRDDEAKAYIQKSIPSATASTSLPQEHYLTQNVDLKKELTNIPHLESELFSHIQKIKQKRTICHC